VIGDALPVPPESAEALLALLRRFAVEGRVEILVDARPLNHIDSPVALESDGNRWAYAILVLTAALWWRQGPAAGLAGLGSGVLLYLTLGRVWLRRRIERRVREQALENLETWRRVWRFKGLTLAARDRPSLAPCASPEGDWMAFVRALS
jgi:hypothetical protein